MGKIKDELSRFEDKRERLREKLLPGKVATFMKKSNALRRELMDTESDERHAIPPPTPEAPKPMPAPDDEDVRAARRRSIASQRARRGRLSTIFTEGEGLGG